ncbi:MAG: hypothetical protein KF768_02295 [Phycisphaeraceae bacterium]|nr:hypothetical protein [Phycisphaeraceae bacterium]
MRAFVIHGHDADTGAPIELSVKIGSVGEAAEFAASRGIKVTSIHAESGYTYTPTKDGGFRRNDESASGSPESRADAALYAFAVLIPLIGLVAGAIRLAKRDPSGGFVILAGLGGVILWAIIWAATN